MTASLTKRNLKGAAFLLVVVFLYIVIRAIFARMEPLANWLTVETPEFAVRGQPFHVRVTFQGIEEETFLCSHLHWSKRNRESQGYLASGRPYPKVQGDGIHEFNILFEDKEELRHLHVIVFLSPTGSWRDRTRGAHTELIPVRDFHKADASPPFKKRKAYVSYEMTNDEPPPDRIRTTHENRLPVRIAISILFSAGSMCCLGVAIRQRKLDKTTRQKSPLRWAGSAMMFMLFASAELFDLQQGFTDWSRGTAERWDMYFFRKPIQEILTVLIISVAVGSVLFILTNLKQRRQNRNLGLILLGTIIYFVLSVASMLSFHAMDIVGSFAIRGILIVDVLKILAAGTALVGSAKSLLPDSPGQTKRS